MLPSRVAATSAAVAAVPGRTAEGALLAECLREAAPQEVAGVASCLAGELRQRRTGTGWAARVVEIACDGVLRLRPDGAPR